MTTTQRNVLANLAGQATVMLITLIFLPLYLPLLGTEAYGLVGFYTALIAVFGLLDAGLGAAASREAARRAALAAQTCSLGNLLCTLERIYWLIAAGAATLCWLASPWLTAHWLHLERLPSETATACLRLLGLGLACRLPSGLYGGMLNGLHRQVSQNVVRITLSVLSAPGSYLLLKHVSRAPETFFIWQLVLAGFCAGVLYVLTWRALPRVAVMTADPSENEGLRSVSSAARPRFVCTELRSVARFAAGSASIGVLSLVLMQADRFLLSTMVPLASLGVYALAQNLNTYFSSATGNIIIALQPRFYELEARGQRAATIQLLRRATAAVGLLLLPLAGLLITRMEDLLTLWLHNPELAMVSARPARWLVAGTTLNSLCTLPYLLLLAQGNTRYGIVQNVIAIFFFVPLLYVLIRVFGVAGGGMAWLALNAGYFLISNPFIFRQTLPEEKWRWLLRDTTLPMLICAAVFGGMMALNWPASEASLATRLFAGGITYLLAVVLLLSSSESSRAWVREVIVRWRSKPLSESEKIVSHPASARLPSTETEVVLKQTS